MNFILPLLPQLLYPCASVVRYARILLCSFRVRFIAASWSFEGGREGGRGGKGGVREGLTRVGIVVGVRVEVQFILMICACACFYGDRSVRKEIGNIERYDDVT